MLGSFIVVELNSTTRHENTFEAVSLVGGIASSLGRLELSFAGEQGSVCQEDFGSEDAVRCNRKFFDSSNVF